MDKYLLLLALSVLGIVGCSSGGDSDETEENYEINSSSTDCSSDTEELLKPDPENPPKPIVIWHGLGDCCCRDTCDVAAYHRMIRDLLPNVYIKSLSFAGLLFSESAATIFRDVNEQVEMACQQISSDPKLKEGFNGIGISQGGQFLRAVVQRCYKANMINLITIGSQHQGIYGIPTCPSDSPLMKCKLMAWAINRGLYNTVFKIVQFQYWHDPYNEPLYRARNSFLADINNERVYNKKYAKRLKSLKNFVMIMFSEDTQVIPKESSWFGFYKPGQKVEIIPLRESIIYTEDLLGLQEMDRLGKLHFITWRGEHLMTPTWRNVKDLALHFLK